VTVADYYLATNGSDNNSGRSSRFPWKTITKLNAAFTAGTIGQGDRVWFRRGDTFYGKIRPPTAMTWPGSLLTFGGYGSTAAARPEISSYKLLNVGASWTAYDATTWQIDLANGGAGSVYTGYDGAQGGGTNIGFLRVDGVIYGALKTSQAALANAWDFAISGTTLYVRAIANPTTLAADIRAACDQAAIHLYSAVQVTGLKVVGSGGHGMKTLSGGLYNGIRVYDCEFAELGGAILTGTTRYGNGLELWADTNDAIAERNIFHDIYDVAFTLQGPSTAVAGKWTDVAFRRNLIYRCNQSMEFWFKGTTTPPTGSSTASPNTTPACSPGTPGARWYDPTRTHGSICSPTTGPCPMPTSRSAATCSTTPTAPTDTRRPAATHPTGWNARSTWCCNAPAGC
jgi:hypothetical protein